MSILSGLSGSSGVAVVYLSQHGITSDATNGIDYGATAPAGATGQEVAINALLASSVAAASAAGLAGVRIVWDVAVALGGPLYAYSNMTVDAPNLACGAIMRASSNCPMWRAHGTEIAPSSNTSTASQNSFGKIDPTYNTYTRRVFDPAFVNIKSTAFLGGTWNGNRAAQATGTTNGLSTTAYGWTTIFSMWGVDGLTIRGTRVFNSTSYGIHYGNCRGVLIQDNEVDTPVTATYGNDCIHANGPANNIKIKNVRTHCSDDNIAFNADDGDPAKESNPNIAVGINWFGSGPITDWTVEDWTITTGHENVTPWGGMRLLSSVARIDNGQVSRVSGASSAWMFLVESYVNALIPGNGNIGHVVFSDFSADGVLNGNQGTGIFSIGANSESIEIRGRYRVGASAFPDVRVKPGTSVKTLLVDGRWYLPSASTYTPSGQIANAPTMQIEGNVDHLRVSGQSYRDGSAAAAPFLRVMSGGTVAFATLAVDGDKITNLVDYAGGAIGALILEGAHRNAGGGSPLAIASGATLANMLSTKLAYDSHNVAVSTGAGVITRLNDYNESAIITYATAYTTALSSASGSVGGPVTVTFTPTSGSWPVGETITPTATSISGAFSPTSLAPSGAGAVTATFTPSAAATGTLNSTISPAMTNTSGPQTYTATVAAALLLDSISAVVKGAYSVRKLRAAYAGSAIRVRRSSDSTEQDIGFASGGLDTTSMLAFVGAGNGFVTRWYDQSSAAQNVVQTTAANQPQIVASGSVISLPNAGAKPSVRFINTSATILTASGFTTGSPSSYGISSVNAVTTGNGNYGRVASFIASGDTHDYGSLASAIFYVIQSSSATSNNNSGSGFPAVTQNTTAAQVSILWNGTTNSMVFNGVTTAGTITSSTLGATGILSFGAPGLNGSVSGPDSFDGYMAENLIFGSYPTSGDQNSIRSSQQSYFGTP